MWSALADGFSEFASVVSQDAKTMYNKTSAALNQNFVSQNEQDEMINQRYDSEFNNNNGDDDGESFSPSTFLSRIRQSEFSKDIPSNPTFNNNKNNTEEEDHRQNWKRQIRDLQQNIEETFHKDLDDDEANMFTPFWLRAGVSSVDDDGIPNDSSERQLFSTGQLLLQNSEAIREVFLKIYPEARDHSLESLQNAIMEENDNRKDDENTKRILPSSFLVRYFVRLNKLFFLAKRVQFQERQERMKQQQEIEDRINNEKVEAQKEIDILVQENEKLGALVRDQEGQIQDQNVMITEYKVRSSDLIQEVDRLKHENSEQEKMIRSLRVEVERLKLSLTNNNNVAASSAPQPPVAKQNNHPSSSSSVDMIDSRVDSTSNNSSKEGTTQEQPAETSKPSVATTVEDVKKVDVANNDNNVDDDDDEEGWTDIS